MKKYIKVGINSCEIMPIVAHLTSVYDQTQLTVLNI